MTWRRTLLPLLALMLAVSSGGCSEDPATQIVLIVDTDLSIPSEADAIALVATGPGGMNQSQTKNLTGAAGELPLVLTLSPASGAELGPFQLTLAATASGSPVVTRQVETSFIAGEGRTLFVFLRKACGSASCGAGQTCGNDGACTSVAIDATTLPPFEGTPVEPDAGPLACMPTGDESCNGMDDDCNGAVDDGDLCPTMSGAPTNGASCMAGACVNSCPAGRGDCDGLYPNGCETSTDDNPNHCGACGNVCDSGACVAGACVGGGFQTSFGSSMDSRETIAGMVLDPTGNLIVAGSYETSLDIRGMTFAAQGSRSIYLAKFAPSGDLMIAKSVTGPGIDTAVDLGIDDSGNVTLLMTFDQTLTVGTDMLDAGVSRGGGLNRHMALLRFDNDLGYLGSRTFGGEGQDDAYALDVRGDGTVTLAGFMRSTATFMTDSITGLVVLRFSVAAGGGFDKVWTKSYGTATGPRTVINDLVTDRAGNVYLAGFHPADLDIDGRALPGSAGFLLQLLNANGGYGWDLNYAGMTGQVRRLATDGDDLLVMGTFTGSWNLDPTASGGSIVAGSSMADGFLGKLAADGSLRWQRSIASARVVRAVGVAKEAPHRVVAVAGFEASAMLLGKSVTSVGGVDVLACHVTQDGTDSDLDSSAQPGLRAIGTTGAEIPSRMAHRGGRLCVGGTFDSTMPIDLLASPGMTGWPPLGDASTIVSSGGDDLFVACFATGGIPLGGL